MLPYLRFHHIGIAVQNIERTVNQYIIGGGVFSESDPIRSCPKSKYLFFRKAGNAVYRAFGAGRGNLSRNENFA